MTAGEIDREAVQVPQRSGLPPCLYVAIAARDEAAIERHVGRIVTPLGRGMAKGAWLIEAHNPPERDARLPLWRMTGAGIFHARRQVWVHVDFPSYRQAYAQAFPAEDLRHLVLDHILNRRVARLKGFAYLRIILISRPANSSSGGLSERWAVEHHGSLQMRQRNQQSRASIQYADLAGLVRMLDIKTGGAIMGPVNAAQSWVRPPLEL